MDVEYSKGLDTVPHATADGKMGLCGREEEGKKAEEEQMAAGVSPLGT